MPHHQEVSPTPLRYMHHHKACHIIAVCQHPPPLLVSCGLPHGEIT